jgi:hypothetical protein
VAYLDDVRRVAAGLPGATEGTSGGVPNRHVLAVRVADLGEKEALLASDPAGTKIFTEPHYNGFPAVLVRLAEIDVDELAELVSDAWRVMAPKALVEEFDRQGPG